MVKRVGIGTTAKHARSMLRSMVDDLVRHERIETTVPRAKDLRKLADKVISMGKMEDAYEGRRRALAVLRTPDSLDKLFNELAPRYAARQGGYTRVMRSRMREGDGAPMAFVEFVDRPGELRAARPPKGADSGAGFAASPLADAVHAAVDGTEWRGGMPTKHGQGVHHVRWRRLGTRGKGPPKPQQPTRAAEGTDDQAE